MDKFFKICHPRSSTVDNTQLTDIIRMNLQPSYNPISRTTIRHNMQLNGESKIKCQMLPCSF